MAINDKGLIFETAVEVKNLIKRIDTHSQELKTSNHIINSKIDGINSKIDDLKDSFTKDKEELLKLIYSVQDRASLQNYKLGLRLAGVIGAIGIIAGGIGSFIKDLIVK